MCFAGWDDRSGQWRRTPFQDLIPVVRVSNQDAPIFGEPEVRVDGIGGVALEPGRRFPDIIPDPAEFPYNEANYRRDFAIVLRPNRAAVPARGAIDVTVTMARREPRIPEEAPAQVARFRIPVVLLDEFRPDTMIPEPSAVTR